MHANTTQVQVQLPAYYPLGNVAMNNNLGFGGGNHHSIDHNTTNGNNNNTTTPLHPYHPSNSFSNQYHNHHPTSQQPQQPQHNTHHGQQPPNYNTSSQHSHSNNNSHTYNADLQKTIPMQHQVDIYQPPHQTLDSDLMNPIMNRQLNNQYASNYHHPYNYHQHYSSQQSSHYNNNTRAAQQEPQTEQPTDQQRSNASTPTPTLTSSLSTVSSASTPSLSSNTVNLQSNHDYAYNSNRQTSPASSIATSSSTFHVPASPEQLAVGSHLPSPLASHSVNMTQQQQTMPTWTPTNNGSCVDQDMSSQQQSQQQQQQQSMSPGAREHVSFNCNSPKNDRPYYPTQAASHLYSPQEPQQQQVWIASMSSEQEILEQDRHHHQRSYSQSSRNSSALGSYANDGHSHNQPSVASQQSNLPAMGLPLLSPTTMLQSDYQPSYSINMHEAPTVMSHADYDRVTPTIPPLSNTNNDSRYPPIRSSHKKTRTTSVGSQRDFTTRARTNSVNSSSSGSSASVLSSLTNTLGSASLGGSSVGLSLTTTHEQEEDEDSDSPTTIQMRPRINAAPRKAVAARVFECSVPGCTKAYTQLHNLKSHERTGHTPVIKLKPFHCIIEGCTKAFSQRKSLALHIKTAHADFKFKPFKCSQGGCQKSYTQLHNLRTHEKTVHLVDLSRKRVKNPSMGGLHGLEFGGSSSCSPPFPSMDVKSHHQHQMSYHSGLGLSYDGLNDLDLGHSGHPADAYHYQRQHDQQQHHHQAYPRLPHMNPMSGIYDR
ncbi:hypothetical protein BGX27_001129 [Mortierella sp. AM989]|nr:hypothetical protein BGX27_001129 [Mortierella sp. AM989]